MNNTPTEAGEQTTGNFGTDASYMPGAEDDEFLVGCISDAHSHSNSDATQRESDRTAAPTDAGDRATGTSTSACRDTWRPGAKAAEAT